ncbi:MAG: RHS repeat-associated core domain-containing protein, partial [Solirubrobacteraceae bacterium]
CSTTSVKTETYDTAGRLKTSAVTSTVGSPLPTVTDEYNEKTGALEKQSTTTEGKTKTITSSYNTLGQLVSYTDADENTSTYEYDIDGRVKKFNDGKGTQTYTYNETTGLLGELVDSSHEGMKFTATYNTGGQILTEGYPNGMTATYTYDATGKPTGLEYVKTTHCKSTCPETWFSDKIVPSIHGQSLEQTSTLSHQAYTYDTAGRLTQVQNTPAGKGCTTRIYAYEEDTNRTSLTTREPNTKGECATEGGTVEKHGYDEADRLTDTGTTYNTFGDITTLPAADAGGAELTSTYYVDNQLQSQKQNEQTLGYYLDPAGRTRETIATGKPTNATTITHYAGPSDTPAWTTNLASEWTRDIPGIDGTLAAIQNNGETSVLQLTNLHGDLIATAYLSETTTELASKADTSEYGVPTVSAPPKYSWLGANETPTELPSGIIAMGARSYIPQLGRFLQPDPIPGGSANAYNYTFGDPINTSDPTGAYSATLNASIAEGYAQRSGENQAKYAAEEAAARAAEAAAEEAAARREAESAAWAASTAAYWAAGPQYFGGEEYYEEWEEWEEWEEEGEYAGEYVSDHSGESGNEEHHIEPGVLYQSLGREATGKGASGSTTPLCEAVAEGPCARLVPDDHSPNVQSQCNRTGQHCSGRRGSGRRPSRGGGIGDVCHASPFAALIGAATGPVGAVIGIGVAVACNGR